MWRVLKVKTIVDNITRIYRVPRFDNINYNKSLLLQIYHVPLAFLKYKDIMTEFWVSPKFTNNSMNFWSHSLHRPFFDRLICFVHLSSNLDQTTPSWVYLLRFVFFMSIYIYVFKFQLEPDYSLLGFSYLFCLLHVSIYIFMSA